MFDASIKERILVACILSIIAAILYGVLNIGMTVFCTILLCVILHQVLDYVILKSRKSRKYN